MASEPSITSQYDPKTDPARKPKKLKDPGWKFAYWPDLTNKGKIACTLCGGEVSGGIRRFKQHLAGGYGDVNLCPGPGLSTEIRREMSTYLEENKRKRPIFLEDDEDEEVEVAEVVADGAPVAEVQQNESSQAAKIHPSSGTAAKKRQSTIQFKSTGNKTVQKKTKTVLERLRKTPEEVVDERLSGSYQPTINAAAKSPEEKHYVDM
ncbi:unnamed protein product [Urochloa humidicola]